MKTKELVEKYYKKYKVQSNVVLHSKRVATLSKRLATALKKKGYDINPDELYLAGMLHDVLKSIEFLYYDGIDEDTKKYYVELKKEFKNKRHGEAAYLVLKKELPEIAKIVRYHGSEDFLRKLSLSQKTLSYCDKRINRHGVRTLQERFDDWEEKLKKKGIKIEPKFKTNIFPKIIEFENEIINILGKKEFEKIFKNVK